MDPIQLPYRSIACGTYDLFEAASLKRHQVRLNMSDGSAQVGLIGDVFARGREEFCRFLPDDGSPAVEFRLDTIVEITDLIDGTRLTTGSC